MPLLEPLVTAEESSTTCRPSLRNYTVTVFLCILPSALFDVVPEIGHLIWDYFLHKGVRRFRKHMLCSGIGPCFVPPLAVKVQGSPNCMTLAKFLFSQCRSVVLVAAKERLCYVELNRTAAHNTTSRSRCLAAARIALWNKTQFACSIELSEHCTYCCIIWLDKAYI